MADVAASPIYRNAIIGRSFSKGSFGISDGLTEAVETLTVTVNKIRGGDLGFAEETLVAQASALDAIFGENGPPCRE